MPSQGIYPLPPDTPHIKVKMLDTVFKIQTIGCYSFRGSHPGRFSFSGFGAFSFTNYYYRNVVKET